MVEHPCIHISEERKTLMVASFMLWLMLNQNVKLDLLILVISALLVAFAALYVWGKPSEKVLAS